MDFKEVMLTSPPEFAHCGLGGNRMWITKILNVNIIYFVKVDKGGGGYNANPQKEDNLHIFFVEPFPYKAVHNRANSSLDGQP